MTNAWFLGASESVPQDEDEARSTVEPIRHSADTAEATGAPDFNEIDTDESGELVGLSPRVVAPDTHESEKYVPFWTALASQTHNVLVDKQVASSGTAAQREESGQQGHGSVHYAEGIEPEIREGAAFGNDYFQSHDTDVQAGAGAYMTPYEAETFHNALAQRVAQDRSRAAYQSSLYAAFLGGD